MTIHSDTGASSADRWKITDPSAAMAAIQKYKERPLGAEVLVPDTEVPLGLYGLTYESQPYNLQSPGYSGLYL